MKIFFVHSGLSSFVKVDLDILRSVHEVSDWHFQRHPHHFAKSIIAVIKGVLWSDLVFCWFGGFHTFITFLIAQICQRPCIVIASGYDVANLPEINYGNMRPGVRSLAGNFIFTVADRILAVSNFTASELLRNTFANPLNIQVIRHGFAVSGPIDLNQKLNRVITISPVNKEYANLKGLETFARAAALLPNAEFIVIGVLLDDTVEKLRAIAPVNLKFTGYVPNAGNSELIKSAKVYVQLSYYESFGCSLAEAMLQGCMPVVANRGALPEVIGDRGFCVPYADVEATREAIRNALVACPNAALYARQRILEEFPLEKRCRLLLEAVAHCLLENQKK